MRIKMFVFGIMLATTVCASPLPYDESVDAKAAVQTALVAAKKNHLPVLVIMGANWCPDCRALDKALQSTKSAQLIATEFNVVKVDVGNFDHNLDLVKSYGNPIKEGIPAAVVLTASNEILYSTKAGELANARHMSESGIYDFFKRVSSTTNKKP